MIRLTHDEGIIYLVKNGWEVGEAEKAIAEFDDDSSLIPFEKVVHALAYAKKAGTPSSSYPVSK